MDWGGALCGLRVQMCLNNWIRSWSPAFLRPCELRVSLWCRLYGPSTLVAPRVAPESPRVSRFLMGTGTAASDPCKHPPPDYLETLTKSINNRHLCYCGSHSKQNSVNSGHVQAHSHIHQHSYTSTYTNTLTHRHTPTHTPLNGS